MELLFLSNVKKKNIYIGKSLTLFILSIASLILSLGSYFISFGFSEQGLSQFKFMYIGNIFANILCLIITMLMLSIIAVCLSITISMTCKSMKNAQILNEIVLTVPIGITALLALGIIRNDAVLLKYIPIINLIACFNNIFSGNIDTHGLIISLFSNFVLVGILIFVSVKYMHSEKMIK